MEYRKFSIVISLINAWSIHAIALAQTAAEGNSLRQAKAAVLR